MRVTRSNLGKEVKISRLYLMKIPTLLLGDAVVEFITSVHLFHIFFSIFFISFFILFFILSRSHFGFLPIFFQKSQKLHMNDLITIQITLFLGDAVEFITSVHLFHMFPVSSQTTFFQVRKHME